MCVRSSPAKFPNNKYSHRFFLPRLSPRGKLDAKAIILSSLCFHTLLGVSIYLFNLLARLSTSTHVYAGTIGVHIFVKSGKILRFRLFLNVRQKKSFRGRQSDKLVEQNEFFDLLLGCRLLLQSDQEKKVGEFQSRG